MAGADLLNGGTGTAVSQQSEAGQGIMCAKEGIGKCDMWYGVVCKAVMSCTSAVFSLAGGRDTVPCLVITAIFLFSIELVNNHTITLVSDKVGKEK